VSSTLPVEGVCEVLRYRSPGAARGTPPSLLIELPHGATKEAHFLALRRRLRSALPPDLESFFFVNTDVGTPECAERVARTVTGIEPDRSSVAPARRVESVLVLRSLIPRTFVDCNRRIDFDRRSELTAAIPDYVVEPSDLALLRELHERYHAAAADAYREVCSRGGTAIQLHSYAPRSVDIRSVGADIVELLRDAYAPENRERWPLRPEVDLITRTDDDEMLAPERLAAQVQRRYRERGIEAGENATYRLHAASSGHAHSHRWPGSVLCLELRRDLLADPFDPFAEMRIGEGKLATMAAPLAHACLDVLRPA
jgi:hypothetical protein